MAIVTWSTAVERTPEDVFDYLADFSRHAEWAARPFKIESYSDGPLIVGSRFCSVGSLPRDWRQYTNDVEVTVVDRPSRLAFTAVEHGPMSKTSPLTFRNEFVLTALGTGTRIERRLETPTPGGLLGVVLAIMVKYVIRPGVQTGMDLLQRNLALDADRGNGGTGRLGSGPPPNM